AGAPAKAVITAKGETYKGTLEVPFNIYVKAGTFQQFGENATSAAAFNVQVARELYPSGASSALLVKDRDYSTQLAVSSYAATAGVPVLIAKQETLPEETAQYLREANVSNVVLVGELASNASKLKALLQKKGISVSAVEAASSGELSVQLSSMQQLALPAKKQGKLAVVANPSDTTTAALAASYAANNSAPVFFTKNNGTLETSVQQAIEGYSQVVIVGDEGQVDVSVEKALKRLEVERIQAQNRYELSKTIASATYQLGASANGTLVVNASKLNQQLSAVQLSAFSKVPIVLVGSSNTSALESVVLAQNPAYKLTLIGGSSSIPAQMQLSIKSAMGWR
ncbi:MAG: cell wall-binding repeat-containing protein, partial [Enterococcus sp.]|nr:cell wall-binding repeat-containing protein [Enterococcus sp.]